MKKKARLKSADDIKRIQESGRIISEIFNFIGRKSLDGLSTLDVDNIIENIIYKSKARPSFKTVKTYNHATCISVNNEVVHGIPSAKKIIKNGDIVKIDIGTVKNGYFADSCRTFPVGSISDNADRLLEVAEEALNKAIRMMIPGNRLGDMGAEVQEYIEGIGFSIVRDFSGHGVGFAVHELPNVPHYGTRGKGSMLREGMVLALEPIINEGTYEVQILEDGWTAVTKDGKLSAQYEHTVAVTNDGPKVLT